MMNEYIFEGEIISKKGKAEVGSCILIKHRIDISCFKEAIVVIGGNGFCGYPSEECYIKLMEWLISGYSVECEILDIKKEGIYNALFRAFK